MKINKLILTITAFTMLAIVSCGGGAKKDDKKKDEGKDKGAAPGAAAESCTYFYDSTSTTVKWIAYKFTGKTPVEGKFDSLYLQGCKSGPSMVDVMQGATFSIPVSSLQTGDTAKNKNIIDHFFGKLSATVTISGSVTEITETSATVKVKMNEVEKDITMECKWEGEKLIATGVLSIDDFGGQKAMEALNKKCKKNHTGEDGVTKVWPEVTVMVETTLKKEVME